MRLALVVAVALLLVVACGSGGGDAPASTVAPPSGGGSVPTAVSQTPTPAPPTPVPPTPTVAQAGGSGISELEAYCVEVAVLAQEFAASEAETWGEHSQAAAKSADALEHVSPPERLKAYPSASIAFIRALRDFRRSQNASEPLNSQVLSRASEVAATRQVFWAALETLEETLDSETYMQMDRCFG